MPNIRENAHYLGTKERLDDYPDAWKSRALLEQMVGCAQRDPDYDKRFMDYIENGSTLKLLELVENCGMVFENDLERHNAFAAIDSAHLHRFDGPLNG